MAGNAFSALGSTVLGTDGSNTLTVKSATVYAATAPTTANANLTANANVIWVPTAARHSR